MPYFDSRLTDAELVSAASVMQSQAVTTLAQRIADRGAIAGRVRDRVLQALALIDRGDNSAAWAHLERCAAALDWKDHVPTYSLDPLEN